MRLLPLADSFVQRDLHQGCKAVLNIRIRHGPRVIDFEPPDTPTGRQEQVYTSRIASFSQPHSNSATKLPIRPRALPNTTKPLGTYFRRVLFPAHHALANCITPCIASEDSRFAIAQQAKCCSAKDRYAESGEAVECSCPCGVYSIDASHKQGPYQVRGLEETLPRAA